MSSLFKNKKTRSAKGLRKVNRRFQSIENLEARRLMTVDIELFDSVVSAEPISLAPVAAEVSIATASNETNSARTPVGPDTAAAANATLVVMQAQVERTGRIALAEIDGLATFAGLTIEAPIFGADGSVQGTTQFGSSSAPVLLQFVPQTGDWVLAIESQLGELLPSQSIIESPLQLESPLFVFSPSQIRMDAAEMSAGTRDFYQRLYQSDDFTIRLERGVNLLTRATIGEDSVAGDLLETLGVSVPSIELEGVILREFTADAVDEFKQARKDGEFWSRFREDMLLRATLPQITIDGLPNSITTGDAYIGWQAPGTDKDVVFAAMDLTIDDGDGTPTELTGRLAYAETPTGSELRLSAVASQMNDAFGVTGLDLHEVVLLLDIDTVKKPAAAGTGTAVTPAKDPVSAVPTIGIGVSARMTLGQKDVMIAGKVELSQLTGTPLKVALRGELSSLSTDDLLQFANRISGLDSLAADSSNLPDMEFRNLVVNIAPLGGDAELGIEDGIGISGELYLNGDLLGRVDGLIDRTGVTPKIELSGWIDEIDLGDLHVSEVEIDIVMTQSIHDRFIVKGSVELWGVSHLVDINITARRMYYRIATEVDGLGMVDYAFEASTLGIPQWSFTAIVRNDLSNTLEGSVAAGLNNWTEEARKDFDRAQANLDAAQAALKSVELERTAAIAEAQREFDEVESDLATAQRAVDGLRSKLSGLYSAERKAKSKWQAAVRARKSAKWYQYAGRRATEAARYVAYKSVQGSRLATQGTLAAASGVLDGVRNAAGWVLDAAGPEAHPKVVALTAELAIKRAALHVAEAAVEVAEDISTGAVDVLAFVAEHHDDLFMIDEIRFEGTLSALLIESSFDLEIDFRFLNKANTLNIETPDPIDLDDLAEMLVGQMKSLAKA